LDLIRAAYEAHRILVGSSEHGAVDATNTVTATAIGTLQTSINTYLNELKADYNAHLKLMTSHYVRDDTSEVDAAASSSLATSITLATAIKTGYSDHLTRADESSGGAIPPLSEE
jgi:hypothetical protein